MTRLKWNPCRLHECGVIRLHGPPGGQSRFALLRRRLFLVPFGSRTTSPSRLTESVNLRLSPTLSATSYARGLASVHTSRWVCICLLKTKQHNHLTTRQADKPINSTSKYMVDSLAMNSPIVTATGSAVSTWLCLLRVIICNLQNLQNALRDLARVWIRVEVGQVGTCLLIHPN